MVLTHANGTLTTNATEQNLFNIVAGGPKHFATWIFLDAMAASSVYQIRVYVRDEADAAERKYIDTEVSGVQTDPAFFVPFVPSDQYRVSIQRTAGTDVEISWVRAEA